MTNPHWHLELFVPGRPAPQGSKNGIPIYRGKGPGKVFTGRVAQVESSKAKVDEWRGDVRAACLDVWAGRAPLDGPIELEVEFIRKRPACAPKSYTPDASTAPDLSKIVRSTEDAITSAGVWADDGRVVRTTSSKRCAEIGETPGAWIRIRLLPTARERAAAVRAGAQHAQEPGKHAFGEAVIKNPMSVDPGGLFGPEILNHGRSRPTLAPLHQPTQTEENVR